MTLYIEHSHCNAFLNKRVDQQTSPHLRVFLITRFPSVASGKQWAAVSTCLDVINAPPQPHDIRPDLFVSANLGYRTARE